MYGQFRFIKEVFDLKNLPPQTLPEFVFWGRSNVGKSSLINSITNSNIAKTSKTPGRTRSLVFFESEKKSRIVDFPGYGYSKMPKNNEHRIDDLIEYYLKNRKSIKFLFLLIDSRHGFKDIDKMIFSQINTLLKKRVIIIFTKTDKLKAKHDKKNLIELNNQVEKKLNKTFFNTSIKNTNDITLFRKFLLKSIED